MHYAFKVTCPTLVILQQYPFILLPLLLQLLLLLPALDCSTTSEGTVVFSHIISNLGSDQSWSSRTSGRSQDPKGRSYALLPVWLWKYSTEENLFTCSMWSCQEEGMGVVYSGLHQSDLVLAVFNPPMTCFQIHLQQQDWSKARGTPPLPWAGLLSDFRYYNITNYILQL